MTDYTRRCQNNQRCPRQPQCGMDCHFDNAEADDLPLPEEAESWLRDREIQPHKAKYATKNQPQKPC